MTAVATMEISQNGVRGTNHDRDLKLNGVNGGTPSLPDSDPDSARPPPDKSKSAVVNGVAVSALDETAIQQQQTPARSSPSDNNPPRMNDLPDEIQHITENFLSLSQLLSRLAQKSHNDLQDAVRELAKRPLPAAPTMNGNTDHAAADDSSPENLDKKLLLLRFAQDQHARWVKALIITEWSRKVGLVSKLIDIRGHLLAQSSKYEAALGSMMEFTRSLSYARLPSPDLKTALQVLSNGDAPWIPDHNYIEPPQMTAQEQLKWLDDLNTMLSLRLTMEDHDKIPYHFRNYKISSGRVTFIVDGEFEVDLTIADEDFEKQFWFIDFRFLFTPAPTDLSETLRKHLEMKVNDLLGTEGLAGCYEFLHEFVLTHKIAELRRQAVEMSRGRWVDTLKIERLNRSMSVQYWTNRFPPSAPKSWIIIGVHSGATPGSAAPNPKATSRLALRWFRSNQEVKDAVILFDTENMSMEAILKTAIARHVEHILSSIHTKLLEKPRFAKREAALALRISATEPADSYLKVQLTEVDSAVTRIDPISGFFAIEPHSRIVHTGERSLNTSMKDPTEDGVNQLEMIRNICAMDELQRRGKSQGWIGSRAPPLKPEEFRHLLNGRETYPHLWYKRQGWGPQFYLLISLSLNGDQWWLIELATNPTGPRIKVHIPLPLSSNLPNMADPFFSHLTVFVTSMISNLTDLRALHSKKMQHFTRNWPNPFLPPHIQVPTIFIRLSEILPSLRAEDTLSNGTFQRVKRPWASDYVRLMIKGVQSTSSDQILGGAGKSPPESVPAPTRSDPRVTITAQASIVVADKSKFRLLKTKVDHDVFFNHRSGEFALRLRAELGEPMIDALTSHLQAIDRLVEFLESISRHRRGVECEMVTLRKVVFTYGDLPSTADDKSAPNQGATGEGRLAVGGPAVPQQQQSKQREQQARRRWKVWLDLSDPKAIRLTLQPDNPHIRVLDMLQRLVNSPGGLESLPFWLPLTLSVSRALERIEDSWQQLQTSRKGGFEIFSKALNWLTIRYTLPSPLNTPLRRLNLDVRLRLRRGEAYWHVLRSDADPVKNTDEFARVLKEIFDGKNKDWKCLSNSAVADTSSGVEELLRAIDKGVRTLLETPPPQPQPPMSSPTQLMQQQIQRVQQHQQSHVQGLGLPGGGIGNAASRAAHLLQQQQQQRQAAAAAAAAAGNAGRMGQGGRPGQGQGQGQGHVVDLT